jgi:ADP-heptose:LPS heptosyltransferase
MIFKKHFRLLRKFLGNLARPRFGWRKKLTKLIKFCYLLVEWPFELLGDLLFFWKRLGKAGISNPRRILIIKIDQFGDVLFSTFLLPIIKKKYPDVEIDYLINPKTKSLLEKNPYISNIYFWEDIFLLSLAGREKSRTGGLGEIRKKNRETMKILRSRHYDAVINTRANLPSSNIPWRRIGGALIAFDTSEQSFLADYWAEYDLDDEEWKDYLNLLRPLGIDVDSAVFHEEFYNFGNNPMVGKGKYVVLSPISFDKERQWGSDNWRRLIEFIIKQGYLVAITGMKDQETYIQDIMPKDRENVFVFTTLTLPYFGALMKGAKFFVGIESFPAHLALACGTKAFVFVFSSTYYIKGFSENRFMIEARNMLPVLEQMEFFNIRSATSTVDIEKVIGKLVSQR